MQCPKCKRSELVGVSVGSTEVDQCPSCHGIWFDEDELMAVIQHQNSALKSSLKMGSSVKESVDQIRGACPRDGSDLTRVYSRLGMNTVIDRCPECQGSWLDGGELRRLISPSGASM